MERPLEEIVDLLRDKYRLIWRMTRGRRFADIEDTEGLSALVAERQQILDDIKTVQLPTVDPATLPLPLRLKYRKLRRLAKLVRKDDEALEERIRRRMAKIQEEMKWRGYVQMQALASYTRQTLVVSPRYASTP